MLSFVDISQLPGKKRVYSHVMFHIQDLKHTFLICSIGSVTPYPQQKLFPLFSLLPSSIYRLTIGFWVELQTCLMNQLYFGFLGQQLEVFPAQVEWPPWEVSFL